LKLKKDIDAKTIFFLRKPKISQIKIYRQETLKIKIFLRYKTNDQTLCVSKSRYAANHKILFP
jgi:hypothetical protein